MSRSRFHMGAPGGGIEPPAAFSYGRTESRIQIPRSRFHAGEQGGVFKFLLAVSSR